MYDLKYDRDDVCEFIAALEVEDIETIEPSKYHPDRLVYIFSDIEYECEAVPLYIKVCLNPDSLLVLSFKAEGSVR